MRANNGQPHKVKLDYGKALRIRSLYRHHGFNKESLAKMFGVGVSCIKNVIYGVNWRTPPASKVT